MATIFIWKGHTKIFLKCQKTYFQKYAYGNDQARNLIFLDNGPFPKPPEMGYRYPCPLKRGKGLHYKQILIVLAEHGHKCVSVHTKYSLLNIFVKWHLKLKIITIWSIDILEVLRFFNQSARCADWFCKSNWWGEKQA